MAFNTWKLKTASFAATGILSLNNYDVNINGSSFDIFGDSNASIEDTFAEITAADVTLTGTDIDQVDGLVRGTGGALVLVFEQRVGADGASAATDKTCTFAAASLQGIAQSAPAAGGGAGSWSLTFRCAGPAGAAIYAWT